MATKPAATKKEKTTAKPVVQYYHDGAPISPYQNKLSSIAYWYTNGCPGAKVSEVNGHEAMSSKDFQALLTKLGVKDPKGTAFEVKLPNGITISATIGKLVPIKPRVKKADQPEAVAARKAAKDNAAESAAFKAEQAKVRAWETNGKTGSRPKTPVSDKLIGTKAPAAKAAAKRTPSARVRKTTPAKAKAPTKKAAAKAKTAPTTAKRAQPTAARVVKRTPVAKKAVAARKRGAA